MDMSGNVYVCSYGETFDSIAKDVYGDEKYAAEILCANPSISGKYLLEAGDEILLPLIYIPEVVDDEEYGEDYGNEITTVPSAPWK